LSTHEKNHRYWLYAFFRTFLFLTDDKEEKNYKAAGQQEQHQSLLDSEQEDNCEMSHSIPVGRKR